MEETFKMKYKDAPYGARFKFPSDDIDEIFVKLPSCRSSPFEEDTGLIAKWNGNTSDWQSMCKWVDEENGYDFETIIELI